MALLLAVGAAPAAFGQFGEAPRGVDLSGEWLKTNGEDMHERGTGPDIGEYWGIPLNDADRMRADSYNAEWLSTSLVLQCRPHPTGYQQLGPDPMRIEKKIDPVSREVIGYRVLPWQTAGERTIYLDNRPRPSEYAAHTWEGFSLGKWQGDILTVSTDHLKESFLRRNGVAASFRRTVTEHITLDEPYLSWIMIVNDPDYLTEPFIRSSVFVRAPNVRLPTWPCSPQQEEYNPGDAAKYRVPHYLTGENPFLTEVSVKFKVPLEGVRGGAEMNYPEAIAKLKSDTIPAAQYTLKPVYNDASTRVAERADAQPVRPPTYDKVEVLHVSRNIYLLAGVGGNISLSVGGDGVVMVNSGAAAASEKVLDAIQQLTQDLRRFTPPPVRNTASPAADTWQQEHAYAPAPIRTIINTNPEAQFTGGNETIAGSKMFHPIGVEGADHLASEVILSHERLQERMIADNAPSRAIPTNTYFSARYRLHRFVNGEGVEVMHLPNATTDGDSLVFFRGSDVISTGAVFNSDSYPEIDVDKGGSIQGEIDALIRIADMCFPEYMSQGGTLVIPGHGHISDVADVAYYRDMLIVIRDRIQAMIGKGMTLEQVKAAKPTLDYDPLFGRDPGSTAKLVDAAYRSLADKKVTPK